MRRALLASGSLVLFVSAALLVACGDDEFLGGGDAEAAPDATADGTVDGSKIDATGGGDTGAGDTGAGDTGAGDTGAGDTGAGDTGADTGSDAGASDSAADVVLISDSGGAITDAGPGGDGAVLNCGNAQCNLPNETCCIYPLLSPPPPFYGQCSNGNSCPALSIEAGVGDAGPATELQCEVQANCPSNNVCCISGPAQGSTGKISAHCLNAGACTTQVTQILLDAGPDAAASDGGFLVQPRAILCDPAALDAGCTSAAGTCSSTNIGTWNVPNGFATCGGKAR
jgi:hypothetical protein